MKDFVHLHTHSDLSQLDGLAKISEYVEETAERGWPAIGITDHGTMRGYLSQHEACSKVDVKPIYGCEFYISPDMTRKGLSDEEKERITQGLGKREQRKAIADYEDQIGLRDRWHITVWAHSQEGLRNLYRLTSAAWIEGFYYKPRIDLKTLIENGEGLMAATGCLASPIHEQWRAGKKRDAYEFADELFEAFGDRMWLEVQPHAIDIQRTANKLAMKLRDRYEREPRLLATQDAHYLHQEDAPHHDVLLCIGTNANVADEERFRFDGDEFFFKTRAQMVKSFKRNHEFIPSQLLKEALDSTLDFAERCNAVVEIDYKKALLPDPGMPKKYKGDAFRYLRDLCLDGWRWRQVPRLAKSHAREAGISHAAAVRVYADRLKRELKEIRRQRFERYFLIVQDIYRYARKQDVLVGPGRGSVGGSLIAYLLGITAVDPIEHGLLFERFINPDRKDLPDIDMDFDDSRRGEMLEYMHRKYGEDRVCQISTVGKLKGKQVFRDVCRVLRVPLVEVNKVTPQIIDRPKHDAKEFECIQDSFAEFALCKAFNRKHPEVYGHANKIEGTAKTLGIHAAGVIASPVDLRDIVPLEARTHNKERVIVSALDYEDVAKIGLVKLDFLGLRTLRVIKDCLRAIEERHGEKIDLEAADFDLNDRKTLRAFTDHDYVGVFQYDSASADQVCKGVTFDRFADVATMTALNRPGTSKSGMDEKFRARKQDPSLLKKHDFHPIVSEIASDTLGILCYQEHLIKIFQRVGQFSPGEADSLRKAIGKKLAKEEIEKYRDRFVEGAKTVGMSEKVADRLMRAIVFFAGYGFNKSHATEYGLIGYWCMWLKVHYPLEFFWSLLKNEPDGARITSIAKEAKRRDIEVLPPHVNVSGVHFAIDEDVIRGSLVDIKGVGDGAAQTIQENAPFEDFVDFCDRVNRRKCNRGTVQKLAYAGAFGEMVNVKWLDEGGLDEVWKRLQRKKVNHKEVRELVEEGLLEDEYDGEERALQMADVSPVAFGSHPLDAYTSFLKREVKVRIETLEGEDYYTRNNNVGHWVLGLIKTVKKHQVGNFGDVDADDPNFGKPYANVNVEDKSGTERRVKFNHFVYDDSQEAIDARAGKPLLIHCTAFEEFSSVRAHFAIDVAKLRQKLKTGAELTIWEQIATGRHPAKVREWKTPVMAKNRITNRKFKRSGGQFCGIVVFVQEKEDRRGDKMAYFGLLGGDGKFIRVIAFASVWGDVRRSLKLGRLVRVPVTREADKGGDFAYFLDDGIMRVYK